MKLRKLQESDKDTICRWYFSKECNPFLSIPPPKNDEELSKFRESVLVPDISYVYENDQGEVCGFARVVVDSKHPETAEICSLMVAPDKQRLGIGKKLLQALLAELRRSDSIYFVVAWILEENKASKRVLEFLEFSNTAQLPFCFFRDEGEFSFNNKWMVNGYLYVKKLKPLEIQEQKTEAPSFPLSTLTCHHKNYQTQLASDSDKELILQLPAFALSGNEIDEWIRKQEIVFTMTKDKKIGSAMRVERYAWIRKRNILFCHQWSITEDLQAAFSLLSGLGNIYETMGIKAVEYNLGENQAVARALLAHAGTLDWGYQDSLSQREYLFMQHFFSWADIRHCLKVCALSDIQKTELGEQLETYISKTNYLSPNASRVDHLIISMIHLVSSINNMVPPPKNVIASTLAELECIAKWNVNIKTLVSLCRRFCEDYKQLEIVPVKQCA